METKETDSCCGALELRGLSANPKDDLRELWDDFYEEPYDNGHPEDRSQEAVLNDTYVLVMFSDIVKGQTRGRSNGMKLAHYIRTHQLGEIVESPIRNNPQTSNPIRLWVWAPSRRGMARMFGPKPTRSRVKK